MIFTLALPVFKAMLSLCVLDSTDSALGTCWMQINSDNTCNFPWETDISREECCRFGRLGTGWSAHRNISSSQMFYWRLLSNGVPNCHPCHGGFVFASFISSAVTFSLRSAEVLLYIFQSSICSSGQ